MKLEDDWRLDLARTPEFYAQFEWEFKKWTQTRSNWDHDHCEFCREKIYDTEKKKVTNDGWTNRDDYHWICDDCFKDFKQEFKWKIKT